MGGTMPGHDVRDFGVLRTEYRSDAMRLPDQVPASGNCAHDTIPMPSGMSPGPSGTTAG